jgi:hypothetical protein
MNQKNIIKYKADRQVAASFSLPFSRIIIFLAHFFTPKVLKTYKNNRSRPHPYFFATLTD